MRSISWGSMYEWVPSAITAVSFETRPMSAAWTAPITKGSGMLRVPSGTTSTTSLPSRASGAKLRFTKSVSSESLRC